MNRLTAKKVRVLSEAINLAYTCLHSPDVWLEMIRLLRQAITADAAAAIIFDHQTGDMIRNTCVDIESDKFEEYIRHCCCKNSIPALAFERGIMVFRPTDIVPEDMYKRSELYNDFQVINLPTQYLAMIAGREKGLCMHLYFGRYTPDAAFTREDVQFLELLLPHVTRAFYKYKEMDRLRDNLDIILTDMGQEAAASLVFDSAGKLLHITKSAKQIIQESFSITMDETIDRIRDSVCETCHQPQDDKTLCCHTSMLDMNLNDRDYSITTQKIMSSNGELYTMVCLDNKGISIQSTIENLACVCGLSRRETAVCKLMLKGATNRKIAELLAISEHTVKDHVRRVLNKLSISSRYQLTSRIKELQVSMKDTPPIC